MKDTRKVMQTTPDSTKPKQYGAFRRWLISLGIMPPPEKKFTDQANAKDEQQQEHKTPIEELERMRSHD